MADVIKPDFTAASGEIPSANQFTEDEKRALACFLQNGKGRGIFDYADQDNDINKSLVRFYGQVRDRSEPILTIVKKPMRLSNKLQTTYILKMSIIEENGGFCGESVRHFDLFDPVYQLVCEAIRIRFGRDLDTENKSFDPAYNQIEDPISLCLDSDKDASKQPGPQPQGKVPEPLIETRQNTAVRADNDNTPGAPRPCVF